MRRFRRWTHYCLGCLIAALPATSLIAGAEARFRRGDVNSDGNIDISDSITELNVLFLGGGTIGCLDAADANDDGQLDISDSIEILSFLFLGKDAMPSPSECGVDPTVDGLGCADYPPCVVSSFSTLVLCDAPARGAMLTGGSQVTVSGRVLVPARVVSLTLNGAPVSIQPGGTFNTTVGALHGLNVLRFAVVDSTGATIKGERSFLWAERYQPGGDSKTARISQGAVLQLTQEAIDNGSQARGTIGDLASLVLQSIAGFDLNGAIPDPLFVDGDSSCICKLFPPKVCTWAQGHAHNLQDSSISTTATLVNGGLALAVGVEGITMDLSVDGVLACVRFDIPGSASATSLILDGNALISEAAGMPVVALGAVNSTLSGLNLNIDLGILGGLASDIVNLFSTRIADLLENEIQHEVTSRVPPILEAALEDLTEVSTQINGVSAEYGLESIDFTSQRCRVGLQTAFTSGSVAGPGPGSILEPGAGNPAFPVTRPINFALSYDALNQLLYAIWAGSAGPIDLTGQVGPSPLFEVSSLLVTPLLPPVILPDTDGSGSLRMEVGDLEFHAAFQVAGGDALEIRGFASGSIAAQIAGNDDRLELQLGALLDEAVEVTETSADSAVTAQDAADLISFVLPSVVAQLAGATVAEFPLPSIDVHALSPSAPAGTLLRARGITVMNGPRHIYCGGRFSQ